MSDNNDTIWLAREHRDGQQPEHRRLRVVGTSLTDEPYPPGDLRIDPRPGQCPDHETASLKMHQRMNELVRAGWQLCDDPTTVESDAIPPQ